MSNAFEEIEYKGYTVLVDSDSAAWSPREEYDILSRVVSYRDDDLWDNLGTAITPSRWDFGVYSDGLEFDDVLKRWVTLIAKGVWYEFRSEEQWYLAYLDGEQIDREWYGDRHLAQSYLEGESEEFKAWCNGEVFYFTIEGFEDETGCGGFYGTNFESNGLLEVAQEEIDCLIKDKALYDREIEDMRLCELGA